MPILPLYHPEPFAATLGVMLYPSVDEEDRRKARAFAAQWLAEPVRRLRGAGLGLSTDQQERLVMDGGALLTDLEDRWEGGLATGELFKMLYILAKNDPALASWESAIKIYEICAQRTRWRPSRAKSEPPLPSEVWRVPLDWKPPPRQPGWPNTGMIPDLALPDDLIAGLKPPGRPRKRG